MHENPSFSSFKFLLDYIQSCTADNQVPVTVVHQVQLTIIMSTLVPVILDDIPTVPGTVPGTV